jgi:hypothetical protein
MSHGPPDLSGVIEATPRAVPNAVKIGSLVLVVLGACGFAYGLATEPIAAKTAVIHNFLYFAGMSQGAFMLAIALMLAQGRWGRPLKRIAEAFGTYTTVLWIVFVVFLVLGGIDVYPWAHPEEHPMPAHKAVWLQPGFFIARQFVLLGILQVLCWQFRRASLRADLGVAAQQLGTRAPAWWARFTDGWRGEEEERETNVQTQMTLAPIIVIAYAIVMSLMAVDVSMSLAPHWYANMFPAWFFMSSFYNGLVWIGLFSLLARDWLGITHLLPPKVYHDLGKLTLGLCLFYAYTLFAQYLAIWYGNMTEETGFILLRAEMMPWAPFAKVDILLCFLIPFGMLVNRSLKKIPSAYLTVASIIAVGLWIDRFMQVFPSVWLHDTLPPALWIADIGVALAFLGGFIFTVTRFLSRYPPVPINDPWMAPHPEDVHVFPRQRAGHGSVAHTVSRTN